MMRHAVRLNSLSEVALTKLGRARHVRHRQGLRGLELDGERFEHLPYHQ